MNIELKINGKAIELSEETKEQIKKACGLEVKVRPFMGETYFDINASGMVAKETFELDIDKDIWNSGNGFFTKEEAEKELDKRQAIQRIKDYILENGMYFEPDWNNSNEKYFFASYKGETQIHNFRLNKFYSTIGYLKSKEDAEKVLKDNKEDLEIIFK